MSTQVAGKVSELKAEISEWPKDQKGSFTGGITLGLYLAALFAKEAGCDIAGDKEFKEFVGFLDRNCPPVRRRSEAAQKSISRRDQLADDVRELLRKAIAGRLRIPKGTYDTSWDAWDEVNTRLLTVVAVANRGALDDAIADIQVLRSIAGGGPADRESVKAEVETCYEEFPIEIAAIERFNELSKRRGFKHNDIWTYLRSNVPVDFGHEDEELREIDARYKSAA